MKKIWIMPLVLVAAACAWLPMFKDTAPEEPEQFLTLSPASLGRSLSLSQLVTGEYDGKIYKIRYEVDITPERLAMVGMSPLGVTLFTIVLENGEPIMETLGKGTVEFNPRFALFDLYLTYWPIEELQPALSRIRMRLEESSNGSVRQVWGSDGELIAEISYPPKKIKKGQIVIQHFNFPYRLRVETLESRGAR